MADRLSSSPRSTDGDKRSPKSPRSPKSAAASPPGAPAVYLQQQHTIEVDSGLSGSETDSTYSGDDSSSFVSSLPSEVTRNVYENGRRYHSYLEGRYAFPNDAGEKEREELKHLCTVMITGGRIHLAPIGDNPQRILDIGTGFGLWAVEMAETYPSAEVIATDLSAVQPTWVPPNLTFEIENAECETGWPYKDNHFDFVHIRYMFAAIRDWPRLIKEAQRVCKPGGWVELCEFYAKPQSDDNTIPKDSKVCEWLDYIGEACGKMGLDTLIAPRLKGLAKEAGFENVQEEVFKLPFGPWPKDRYLKSIGQLKREEIKNGASGLSLAIFSRALGWDVPQIEAYLVDVRKEMMDQKIHSYWPTHFVFGQKPEL